MTESMTVAELFRALRAHRLSMWLAGGTTFAIVVAFVLLVPPRYRSEALLRVESKSPDAGLLGSLDEVSGLSALGLGRDEVETEIGVRESRRMRDATATSPTVTERAAVLGCRTGCGNRGGRKAERS